MEERVKTVPEVTMSLGVSRRQVYRLLEQGKLSRVPNSHSDRGRPVTLISVSSIVNYLKTN